MNCRKINFIKLIVIFSLFAAFSTEIFARAKTNLDYDGKADFLVFRPNTGTWYGFSSETGNTIGVQWGLATDKPVPADYDGDGITDVAVFRPETGIWYVLKSSNQQILSVNWGLSTDVLVPADYDGDGQTDFAVWRKSTNYFYVLTSTSGYNPQYFRVPLPSEIQSAEVPVPADYDGDGKTDFAVKFLNSWYIFQSASQTANRVILNCPLGVLVPADFTGDGKADPACVYMMPDVNFFWRVAASENNQQTQVFWGTGLQNDLPVPDDYDNDGHMDYAVYRQGQWWIYPSGSSQAYVFRYGTGGDVPAQWFNLRWNS